MKRLISKLLSKVTGSCGLFASIILIKGSSLPDCKDHATISFQKLMRSYITGIPDTKSLVANLMYFKAII
jgi:hypothetical protein